MELTVENFQEARQICIKAVLEAMKTLAPQAYIGGEGSEDGIYVAGVNEQNRILYITHFDWEADSSTLFCLERQATLCNPNCEYVREGMTVWL